MAGRPRVHDEEVQMSVRVSPDLAERIDDIAEGLYMSRADCLRSMLNWMVEAIEQGELEMSRTVDDIELTVRGNRRR